MSIRVAIHHKTIYRYDRPVSLYPHIFRLRPAAHSRTAIKAYSFKLSPKDHFINWQQDPFGNYQARVVFQEQTRELKIEVELIADLTVINPFDFFVEEYAEQYPFVYSGQMEKELAPYLEIIENGPRLMQWISQVDRIKKIRIVDFLVHLNSRLNKEIAYNIRMEPGVQTAEETLRLRLGSCRDSAWLLVQILRHLGLAARFVSGYLVQLTADIKSLDGPSGPEKDFTDLHAWTEVYIPGAGWIGLDPTSGLFAGEGHIPLACTPDYASAAPVVGASDEAGVQFEFENRVSRIREDPRVTQPFSEEQWLAIDATGKMVDEDCEKNDLRMTMGGEPTFVSIDDMESEQWNTAADGKEKKILSHDLIFRLRAQFGPEGMIQYGQGKWYPGEPLPRWQFGLYWRKDCYPVWKNTHLIAHEKNVQSYGPPEAAVFIKELARHLAVNTDHISPAYEDVFYFLWTEGKLPPGIDPLKSNLKDPIERKRLTELLDTGLGTPTGYVLPLRWNSWNNKWQSGKWKFKRDHLFLIPGNSPIGLRLPLDSLSAKTEIAEEPEDDQSLFEQLPALPAYHETIGGRYGMLYDYAIRPTKVPSKEILIEAPTIKTAISAETRQGILHIFIPPLHYLEYYLDMVASIEATSAKLRMPVRIEGYEPPRDYRLERLVVSPDPGVIEVNIHPARSWAALKLHIDTLYEQARLSRLGTEKFMVDGRHTGTGGGNHITIGGATPSDSPILRRPDLLRSLITYWQHHPGLSYLFSGAFIGPTSQAPRIDEGRDEKLYEMEIAFSQVPEKGPVPFWLVDRIFRHLLTDLTGNTHRSEFCIDKLYSPDTSSRRLGILEFRAFDMPPHKRMSLLQMLLLRGLIASFWKKPYAHKLVRWGTELHDKYMLPYYVEQDIKDVVQDLNDYGYPFQLNWFDSFFEFRFVRYGTVSIQDMELEIRMGIEPWHVLGEEMSSTGTARYVDSSLERLQVRLSGYNGFRYVLMCNGMRVPLRETVIKGEWICGIRYRAWQPPSALHPTISTDTPLVFDIVDSWNSRSIGGCTYHVSHPGGRSYDTFPVNSYEAESRRVSRFWDQGHTQETLRPKPWLSFIQHYIEPGRPAYFVDAPEIEVNEEYPCTLDLRKVSKKGNGIY